MIGTIKWFDRKKGFGFIAVKGEDDCHLGSHAITGLTYPEPGEVIYFEIKKNSKGSTAINVSFPNRPQGQQMPSQPVPLDKMACKHCGKHITPRIIARNGQPQRSICPFCGSTVKYFGLWQQLTMVALAVLFILGYFLFYKR